MPDDFNVVILPRAAKDLRAIFGGLLAVSPEGALSVHDQLRKSIELLAILPRRNKV